jgi:hypothetical protein
MTCTEHTNNMMYFRPQRSPFTIFLGRHTHLHQMRPMSSDNQVGIPHDSSNNNSDLACSSFASDLLQSQDIHLITTDWTSELARMSLQFSRGVEEANKFVPSIQSLAVDLDSDDLLVFKQAVDRTVGQKSKHPNKTKEHPCLELLEARKSKYSAISTDKAIRDEMFDRVLLCNGNVFDDTTHSGEARIKIKVVPTCRLCLIF